MLFCDGSSTERYIFFDDLKKTVASSTNYISKNILFIINIMIVNEFDALLFLNKKVEFFSQLDLYIYIYKYFLYYYFLYFIMYLYNSYIKILYFFVLTKYKNKIFHY